MRITTWALALVLSPCVLAAAEMCIPTWKSPPPAPAYRWSQVVFVSAHAADLASNWYGGPEANPILATHGRLRGKGLAIKLGYVAGYLAFQEWAVRKKPRLRKVFTVMNFVGAGMAGGIAARNVVVKRRANVPRKE